MTVKEWGFGAVMVPIRLALVGGSSGPDLFEICELIGKEETIQRIETAISKILQFFSVKFLKEIRSFEKIGSFNFK